MKVRVMNYFSLQTQPCDNMADTDTEIALSGNFIWINGPIHLHLIFELKYFEQSEVTMRKKVLVPGVGFEPTTLSTPVRCTTN